MNLLQTDWLRKWSTYSPNKVALRCTASGREYSYGFFYRASIQLALELKERFHIQSGDRIAVMADNDIDYVVLFYAAQRLGSILVPINTRFTAREVEHVLVDSQAQLLIWDQPYRSAIESLIHEQKSFCQCPFKGMDSIQSWIKETPKVINELKQTLNFDDPCMILYTSGTTGFPKGAIITHKMIFWNAINTDLRLDLRHEDKTLIFLPLFHTGGWNVLTTPFIHKGAELIFTPKFEPDKILEFCKAYSVSILFGVPTMLQRLSQSYKFKKENLQSLRYAIVGGEAMPVDLIQTWQKLNVPIRQGYGLTEFGPNVFSLPEKDSLRKIGSIGLPNFYVEAKVINEYGEGVQVGEVGELLLRGPVCTPGYWNHPQATSETIKDNWLHTGDLVKFDNEGYYYVAGRKKDMYISGGENVYPVEVEQFLLQHPEVDEAAIISKPDALWGEVGVAFLVTDKSHSPNEDQIRQFCQKGLAKFKVPKEFRFINSLPKGENGKILKRELRL